MAAHFIYGNDAMNFIINRIAVYFASIRTYESHYERHNHLVSAKYGVAKFSHLNSLPTIYIVYTLALIDLKSMIKLTVQKKEGGCLRPILTIKSGNRKYV